MSEDRVDSTFHAIATEQVNPRTLTIDQLSTIDMLTLINQEDTGVAPAVAAELPSIARAVDEIAQRMRNGGRLVYCGAGTSGRLGVLDASECPPTFGVEPGRVIGVIAGGAEALVKAQEGAEDNRELGRKDMQAVVLSSGDVLVGIATSGRTPYVLAAMEYARSIECLTIGLSCSPDSPVARESDVAITPVPGPEVITGSTRMKAGTATKLVLNMLSTGTMIRLGKVYGNLMVDVRATNEKLKARARRIVMQSADVSLEQAESMLDQTGYDVRLAVFALLARLDPDTARTRLEQAGSRIHHALAELDREVSQESR